jgi:Schitoviridae CLP protease
MNVIGQDKTLGELDKLIKIFINSECKIKPHFILTGPSGCGKSMTIKQLADMNDVNFLDINAAQLTKEGTAGNSLSKALNPLLTKSGNPTICFIDEFDKLFLSGNSNSDLAHESTNGVQNEFLKVLESDETSVFGDYGKYINASTKNVLFVFAGAFNGEEDVDLDRLRDFGVKTEFLGRVGLIYNIEPLTLENLFQILETSELMEMYIDLFDDIDEEKAILDIKGYLKDNYTHNTIGARMINTLINQYFIKGGLPKNEVKKVTFQNKLTFKND